MGIRSYRDLVAWQKAVDLVQLVYLATGVWPREEQYLLTSQTRRAAVSVASNIAEGQGRASTGEFLSHLGFAYGSLMELETQVIIAQRLGYLSNESFGTLASSMAEVGRLINGLSSSLSQKRVQRRLTTGH